MPENTSNTYNAMIDYYDDDYVPEYDESDYSYTYTHIPTHIPTHTHTHTIIRCYSNKKLARYNV